MTEAAVPILRADLSSRVHCEAVLAMMDAYSADPYGDGAPLADSARSALIPGLRGHPTTLIFLAIADEGPVGIAVCFRGFSTFAARPLVNISDFYVRPEHRGTGVGQRLLQAVEDEARRSGCCKLTLEVQENNRRARGIYAAFGFSQAVFVAAAGGALALSKPLH